MSGRDWLALTVTAVSVAVIVLAWRDLRRGGR